jgi:4-alpha-glucanotransferase
MGFTKEGVTPRRKAGVVLPLFSIRTRRDWGIGQITDLGACAAWVRRAGQSLLQILPPHELSVGETSPYGALTAFGLDPVYAGIEAVEDLDAEAIDVALGDEGRRTLERVREARAVDYDAVRSLKGRALRAAFARFYEREHLRDTPRARRLQDFVRAESAWLEDLALYTVLRESQNGYGWRTWPSADRDRAESALEGARERFERRILEVAFVQWTLNEQWQRAHSELRDAGVELMGDLPFVVGEESADAWSHASQFQLHMSLGAPPDAFSPDGQEWGLPPYDWLAMEADDLAWVRARTRRAMRLYDRFRLDHVVGYFRQWIRPRPRGSSAPQHVPSAPQAPEHVPSAPQAPEHVPSAPQHVRGYFDPDGPDAQRARGRRVLGAVLEEVRAARENGIARAIAEDLGVVPPFVREALAELGMPGYKVIPWEKDDQGRFHDPTAFPPASVASWSTHDTPPITAWWDDFAPHEREELARRAGFALDANDDDRSLAMMRMLFGASSDLTLVLAQELLASRERINTPATVGAQNWSWRLPRPIDDLERDERLNARLSTIRAAVKGAGRGT